MSDDIERTLRDAMAAHENEAPRAVDFEVQTDTARAHRRWPVALAAAAVVVAGVTVGAVLMSDRGDHGTSVAAPADCPQQYQSKSWVPANPSGVDGDSRLVPTVAPASIVVCAYLSPMPNDFVQGTALTGTREIEAGFAALASNLTWVPRPPGERVCTDDLRASDINNYLIQLTYPSGTVWVSAPGDHCSGTTNGQFDTGVNVSLTAADAYRTGIWPDSLTQYRPALPDNNDCYRGYQGGRLGQERAMVPDHPIGLTICVVSGEMYRSVTDLVSFGGLVSALNAGTTQASTSSCQGDGNRGAAYELRFEYAVGPPVHVRIDPHCSPSIDNGGLQATNTDEVMAALTPLLDGH